MPRRRGADNREVAPDPVYNSTLAEKFICSMMWDGKKTVAQGIFYGAMDKIRDRFGWDAIGYGSVVLEGRRLIPDAFRELAEKEL